MLPRNLPSIEKPEWISLELILDCARYQDLKSPVKRRLWTLRLSPPPHSIVTIT